MAVDRRRSAALISSAFLFTALTLAIGYQAFGLLTSLIFSSGFLGGFVLWLLFPSNTPYETLKAPYFMALFLFLAHRVEEKVAGFFDFLSRTTGVPTPDIGSWEVVSLVLISVGAWLSVPFLMKKGYEFGYYLAWTFFAAMGITELAHWIVFPFFVEPKIQYIPGMISVVFLAPVAWWGMLRLSHGKRREDV